MNITKVQTIRKIVLFAALVAAVFVFAVTDTVYPSGHWAHELIEWVGIVLIMICVMGRTWSSLYIAGRKGEKLVSDGPYSVTRNPLYVFSIIGAAGMGAQTGSIMVGLICGIIAWIVFFVVVTQEEKLLLSVHGKPYRDYIRRVPRFFPKWSLWKDVQTLTVLPSRIVRTFADALLFLLAVPIAEGFEYLQESGIIPVLMTLP